MHLQFAPAGAGEILDIAFAIAVGGNARTTGPGVHNFLAQFISADACRPTIVYGFVIGTCQTVIATPRKNFRADPGAPADILTGAVSYAPSRRVGFLDRRERKHSDGHECEDEENFTHFHFSRGRD
jgi:hypothetical protein